MGEPEAEPSAPPETLASQCEHSGTADDINRDTDAPQSPNPTNDVAVSEAELGDKGTECLAGEMGTIAEKFALDEEEEEVGTVAGDDNPSVKEEKGEAEEGSTLEIDSSVKIGQLTETETLHEAVIAGTEEVLKEEDSQIDHEVRIKEGDDDQMEASIKEEASPAVEEGSFSKAGATGELVVAGSDDIMPKENEEVEQEVELIDETETKEEDFTQDETDTKEEDFTQTDEEAPHSDHEMVHMEASNESADGLQSGDNNPTQYEETNMDDHSMHNDHGRDKAMDEDLTQDRGGDKAMDEDSTQDGGGDKAMDDDSTQDGGGDKAMDETTTGVDGDGMDDDGADDQAAKHGDEGMGMNDGEDEEDDDPPTLPAKKSSGGKKKRGRPQRVKKGEEELCFICFDGGELVVCDRRSDY